MLSFNAGRRLDDAELLNRVNLCLYLQAIDGVNKGQIKTEDKLYELKALQESNKNIEVSRCMADDSVK